MKVMQPMISSEEDLIFLVLILLYDLYMHMLCFKH